MFPRKLLLVEDHPPWLAAAKEFFENTIVKEIPDGTGAADWLSKNPDTELVLLDFDLGEGAKNGRDVLREIRSQDQRVCVGLLSSVDGGFSMHDAANLANFAVDKTRSMRKRDVLEDALEGWSGYMASACEPRISTEWGQLGTVIVHRPSGELEYVDSLDPFYLMEARPLRADAGEQHGLFVEVLQQAAKSVVLDVRRLLLDVFTLADSSARERMLADILRHGEERRLHDSFSAAGLTMPSLVNEAIADSRGSEPEDLVRFIYDGWHSDNWPRYADSFGGPNVALLPPMNNSYFTRDPGFALDGLFCVSRMTKAIRRREARVLDLVLSEHPWFSAKPRHSFLSDEEEHRIEGGDVVAFAPRRLAVGWSERTSFESIKNLSTRLLKEEGYDDVLVVPIPATRAFMHLDTVFSIIGERIAVVYPEAVNAGVFRLTFDGGALRTEHLTGSFTEQLERQEEFTIVQTAGGGGLAQVEQFEDATNCLAIDDRRVVCYEGNEATNSALVKAGVEVLAVPGAELVKGRGGPRCMSMPIQRR